MIRTATVGGAMGRRGGVRRRGLSLMAELLLVVALVAVMGIGVVGLWPMASDALKLNRGRLQVVNLVAAIKDLYGGQASYTGITSSGLVTNKAVPTDMISGTSIIDAWGNAITVTSPASSVFQVSMTGIKASNCVKLAMNVGGFYSLSINSGAAYTQLPTMDEASTDCSSATNNTVAWQFN